MSLVSSLIPNLINGISQQPVALRLPTQGETQVNGLSSVVDGLAKRPPFRWLAKVMSTVPADAAVHLINRDAFEQYVVIISGGDLRVFTLDGVERVVAFPDGKTYLSGVRSDFQAVTVADHTFVLNKGYTASMSTATSSSLTNEALVHVVRAGGANVDTYTVKLNGVATTFLADTGAKNQTTEIAQALAAGIGSAYSVSRRGSLLRIRRDDGADFDVQTEDSFGDEAMTAHKRKVQNFEKLPARAFNNFKIEVVGDDISEFDSYWMEYDEAGGINGGGVWRETLAPQITYSINSSTMPHVLVRESDGTFTFRRSAWGNREVGDNNTNPVPSFIGRKINDIFFHRNRLGFVADENAILSRSGEFFNFWSGTATTVLDTDPIDLAASHVKVSILRHALPFNEELLLFSDQTQFILKAQGLLTPDTGSIRQVTEFESDLRAKPVGAGQHVYFTFKKGRYTGLREYFTQKNSVGNDAEDATSNVPKFVPDGVFRIIASSNEQTLAALSDGEPNRVYIYRYYYSGGEVVQAAWSYWEAGPNDTIMDIGFIDSDIVAVVGRADGVHLCSITVAANRFGEEAIYSTLLDMRIDQSQLVSRTYDAVADETSLVLPYENVATDRELRVLTKTGVDGQSGGVLLANEAVNATTVTVTGDHTATEMWIGEAYRFLYRFSYPMLRETSDGGGQVAITTGRLQVRNMSVTYSQTGFFEAHVSAYGETPSVYTFTGVVLGEATVGAPYLGEGTFNFPIMSRNDKVVIDLVNDTHLPCVFLSAEWEGYSVTRSRRI